MRLGIGIPNSLPSVTGGLLLGWAKRSEKLGFSSLGTIGRVAYPTYEELVTLAAAAAATERIGLMTDVLLGPTRDPVLLAKEAATLDQISNGRFVLGVGVGGRPDDFEASGTTMHDRGRRWDRALELLHQAWRGEPVAGSPKPICPRPTRAEGVPLMFGGSSDQVVRRVVRWGIGWTAGGAGLQMAASMYAKILAAWAESGRPGKPEFRALTYFALGSRAEQGREYLVDYYGPLAERIWPNIPRDPNGLRETVASFEAAGTDELLFMPAVASLDQVEMLAEAVL